MRTFTRLAAVTSLAGLEVLAANNWQQPCFSGHCTYELPATHNTSSAALHIWGSQNAISDVTTAGGWHILNCDPQTPAQDIRLVCTSHNASAAGCDHVMQGGAQHTIVRLPENCTNAPFARIANASVAEDQNVPAHTKRALFGRDDAPHPQVHSFTLDTNFAAVDTTRNGNVSFAVQGLNIPGRSGDFTITPPAQTRRGASRRRARGRARGVVFGGLPLLSRRADPDPDTTSKPAPTDTTSDAKPTGTTSGAGATTSAKAKATTSRAGDATASSSAGDPQQTDAPDPTTAPKSSKLPPFQFKLHENLFNESVACTVGGKSANAGSSAKVSVDLDAQATMEVVIGVDASGTLSPPKISDISLTASVLGTLDGKLSFSSDASGKFNVPSKVIAQKAISGLNIPGILNVTPTFLISAQAQGSLGIGFVSSVDLKYNISSSELTFPPKKAAPKPARRAAAKGKGTSTSGAGAGGDTNSASVQRGDSGISLSTSSGVNGNADVSAHVIPQVGVALSGLGESTNIVLQMDTSAGLTVGPNSGDTSNPPSQTDDPSTETTSAPGETTSAEETSSAPEKASTTTEKTSSTPKTTSATEKTTSATEKTTSVPDETSSAETAKKTPTPQRRVRRASTGSAQVCTKITTGMNIHANVDGGDFFGLFTKTAQAQLFNKNFTLLNKCFPAGKASGTMTKTKTASKPAGTATDESEDTDTTSADPTSTPADATDAPESTSDGPPTADPDATVPVPTATPSGDDATETEPDAALTDAAVPRAVGRSRGLVRGRGGGRRDVWRAFSRQAKSNNGLQCSATGAFSSPQPVVSQTVPADGQ